MQAATSRHGASLAVGLIPTRENATAGSAPDLDALDAHCTARGVPCLSLVPALHAAERAGERPYFTQDFHWTSRGHRVAARELERFLIALRPTLGK